MNNKMEMYGFIDFLVNDIRIYHMYISYVSVYFISYTIKFYTFRLRKVIYWFSNLFIFYLFLEAHRALELLEDYHAKLTRPQDKQLRLAIERVIRIFKSRLFQALLGKSDDFIVYLNFYIFEIIRIEILIAVSKNFSINQLRTTIMKFKKYECLVIKSIFLQNTLSDR